MDDARFNERSRHFRMSDLAQGEAGDEAPQAPSSGGRRRHVLGSLGAAGLAALAMLKLGEGSAAAKSNQANAARKKRRKKPGPSGPQGPSGSSGPQGSPGSAGPQGEPGPAAGVMSWARVSARGELVSGHGVDSVSQQINGIYTVHFADTEQNFNTCAITATTKRFDTAIDVQSNFGTITFRIGVNGLLASDDFSCIVICPAT